MKLNPDFLLYRVGDDAVLVPVDSASAAFHGIVRLNETAAFLVKLLEDEQTAATLTAALDRDYQGTPEQHARSVEAVLRQLREIGALTEG